MSKTCPEAPTNKREYIEDVGKILIEDFGKKPFYKPEEVRQANRKTKWYDFDWGCWAMSVYSTHEDYDQYHAQAGELCDYAEMKTEMLSGMVSSDSSGWFDTSGLDLSSFDIDASWLDFGDVFESIFEGIGDIVGGILDGIG